MPPQPTGLIWLALTPHSFFLFLFLQIYLDHLLHCSSYLIVLLWICNQQINVLVKYIASCSKISIFTAFVLGFFLMRWATVTLIIRWWISFRLCSIDWEIIQIPYIYSPFDLPKGLFVKMNFSKVLSNLKMVFFIAFNLVSE